MICTYNFRVSQPLPQISAPKLSKIISVVRYNRLQCENQTKISLGGQILILDAKKYIAMAQVVKKKIDKISNKLRKIGVCSMHVSS
jgi:hypothetical protein